VHVLKRACACIDTGVRMQVIQHLAMRLEALHAAGYVHRDLKPANVMWLPRENQWTVIDFGCAAEVGKEAPVALSISYAAPEAIVAYRSGQKTHVANPALDIWSLGVMAFELLTGVPALRLHVGRKEVRALHVHVHMVAHGLYVHIPHAYMYICDCVFLANVLGALCQGVRYALASMHVRLVQPLLPVLQHMIASRTAAAWHACAADACDPDTGTCV
jgi:Protein kinase domain